MTYVTIKLTKAQESALECLWLETSLIDCYWDPETHSLVVDRDSKRLEQLMLEVIEHSNAEDDAAKQTDITESKRGHRGASVALINLHGKILKALQDVRFDEQA